MGTSWTHEQPPPRLETIRVGHLPDLHSNSCSLAAYTSWDSKGKQGCFTIVTTIDTDSHTLAYLSAVLFPPPKVCVVHEGEEKTPAAPLHPNSSQLFNSSIHWLTPHSFIDIMLRLFNLIEVMCRRAKILNWDHVTHFPAAITHPVNKSSSVP